MYVTCVDISGVPFITLFGEFKFECLQIGDESFTYEDCVNIFLNRECSESDTAVFKKGAVTITIKNVPSSSPSPSSKKRKIQCSSISQSPNSKRQKLNSLPSSLSSSSLPSSSLPSSPSPQKRKIECSSSPQSPYSKRQKLNSLPSSPSLPSSSSSLKMDIRKVKLCNLNTNNTPLLLNSVAQISVAAPSEVTFNFFSTTENAIQHCKTTYADFTHLAGPTVDHQLNLTGVDAKIRMREPADVSSPVVVSGAIIVSLYTFTKF